MAGGFGGHTKIGEERGTAALGWETLGGWVRKRWRRSGRGTLGRQAPDSGGDRVQKMWAGWAGLEEGAWGRSVGEGGVGGERARCLASLVDGLSCKTWGGCAGCCVTGCRAPPGPSLVCFASTFVYSRPLKRWQLLSSGALAGPAAARKLPCRSELLARLADVADDAGGDVGVAQVDCRAGRGRGEGPVCVGGVCVPGACLHACVGGSGTFPFELPARARAEQPQRPPPKPRHLGRQSCHAGWSEGARSPPPRPAVGEERAGGGGGGGGGRRNHWEARRNVGMRSQRR